MDAYLEVCLNKCMCIRIYIYIYICIYIRYHTITDVYTTALLLTKPSSDDDSGFRHGLRAVASLPLAQSTPAVSHDTPRLYTYIYIYIYIYVCVFEWFVGCLYEYIYLNIHRR